MGRLKGGFYLLDLNQFNDVLMNESASYEDLEPLVNYVLSHLPQEYHGIDKPLIVRILDDMLTNPNISISLFENTLTIDYNVAKFDEDVEFSVFRSMYLQISFVDKTINTHTFVEI